MGYGVGSNTGIGGSAGATDNAILRADVGAGTIQNSLVTLSDDGNTFNVPGAGVSINATDGNSSFRFDAASITRFLTNTYGLFVGSSSDAGIARVAAKVLRVVNNDDSVGWFYDAGRSRVASDVTNITTTMANITGLSATLISGRHYSGRLIIFCSDSVAADGIKFDFDGGTVTATDFRAHGTLFDTALLLSAQTTALATDFVQATVTGAAIFECHFEITASANGTLIPRFAQNAHTTGTATATRGSFMILEDTP